MGTGWPIRNTELWEATRENPTVLHIRMRKWRWIRHTMRKAD
jgi:hypothetical protein